MKRPQKMKRSIQSAALLLALAACLAIPAGSQFAPEEASGYYLLDQLGGLYAVGSISAPLNFNTLPKFDPQEEEGAEIYIALALTPDGKGLWALTNYGRVLTQGNAMGAIPYPLFGFDIARDIESASDQSSFYILDGFGGVHEQGGAPLLTTQGRPYFDWDIARDIEICGDGYFLLDGFGGVHVVGSAAARLPLDASGNVIPSAYFGWDIAKDLELVPDLMGDSGYYVMDGFGAVHRRGDAAIQLPNAYFGWDISRDLELLFFSDYGYTNYQLDGLGGMHPSADQSGKVDDPKQLVRFSHAHYFAWDIAVDFEVVKIAGTPVLMPTRTPTPTPDETSFVPTFTPTMMSTPTATLTQSPTPLETEFAVDFSVLIDPALMEELAESL